MPIYPVCVTCHSTDSEVDVVGVCTTCSSRGSARDTRADGPAGPPPRLRAFEPDATRTEDAPTAATPPPDRPRSPVGERFPEYSDLVLLERGGMGVVYRARQVRTGRTVALKTMNVVATGDDRQGRRFRTEAEALARLSHPGIVQIYEASERDGVPYLAMEFVPGGSLSKYLRTGPPVTVREGAELAAGVASALAAAHARGITHRDIKPSNVLLTPAGKPKLTDFGLACLTDATTRLTLPGSAIGTPAYMAPEQADPKSFGPVGPLADVYSLGATLYELLTGRPPFAGDTAVEVLYKVCHAAIVPPRTMNPAIPADLESICLRCLEKRPEDRFASAALLANALTRFLRGEPVGRPALAFRVRKMTRQYGKVVAAGLAAAVVAGATGAGLFRDRPQPNPEAETLAAQTGDLHAGREIAITRPGQVPLYTNWIRGATAVRTGRGPLGSFGFRADAHETWPSLLELVPDTVSDSYEITGEIMMGEGGAFDSFVGIYLMEPGDQYLRQTRVVGFCEFVNYTGGNGTNRLQIRDYLTLNRYGNILPSENLHDHSRKLFTPFGENPKDFRAITIVVTPEKILARIGGPFGPNEPKEIVAETVLNPVDERRRITAQPVLDECELTHGRTLAPMPSRGAIGLMAYRAEIAVRNLRLKPIPTP